MVGIDIAKEDNWKGCSDEELKENSKEYHEAKIEEAQEKNRNEKIAQKIMHGKEYEELLENPRYM